jgi:anti-sigma factor RsiW
VTHVILAAQVDAWLDGELALGEAQELEAHLASCPDCAHYRDERLELRVAIRSALPRLEASNLLRSKVAGTLREARRRESGGRTGPAWSRIAVAASLVLVAVGSWQLGLRQAAGTSLADEVLRTHVRSLMPGHLTDIQSTDQHTVKPWFNGVLDYSPPVWDFAGRGYPLIGGRLEYIGDRRVAALVYGRRKHFITALVWPAGREGAGGSPGTRQGIHLLHWSTPSFVYWVASDLGLPELTEFSRLIQQADSAAAVPSEPS